MKMLVMANKVPYNDMVFDGHLRLGKYLIKTRSYNLNYRGPVLFYNSSRTEPKAVSAYKYENGPSNHKVIIGIADLVEVRPLTEIEARKMVLNFNNLTPQTLAKRLHKYGLSYFQHTWFWLQIGDLIKPYHIGLFFENAKRFEEPVPFSWPAGPVRPITIQTARYPKLHAQILRAKHS